MTAADVGRIVHDRRVERGYRTRESLAEATDLTSRTLSDIEVGRRYSYNRSTLTRLEQVLGMESGSIQAMLDEAARERNGGNAQPPKDRPAQPPAPVDIGPELATIDGLAMWMRPDFHPLGFLLHHAGLDEKARFTVALEMREVTERAVLGFLDALADKIRREGGKVRREAWPPWLVDRFGWKVPDGEDGPPPVRE